MRDVIPGRVVHLFFQRSQGVSAVEGIEILADDIFHQLLQEDMIWLDLADDGGDCFQTGELRRSPASLTVDYDVDIVLPRHSAPQLAAGRPLT